MSEELDVSWFDLEKYDFLAELDLSDWLYYIEIRKDLFDFISVKKEPWVTWKTKLDEKLILQIQTDPSIRYKNGHIASNSADIRSGSFYLPFNTYSVFSTSAFSMWTDRNRGNDVLQEVWNQCKHFDECFDIQNITSEKYAPIFTPYDFFSGDAKSKLGDATESHIANVKIDLTATNEQIIGDFKHWLTEYRKATGYESEKKNFTDKDLLKWRTLKLLPYIDLMLSKKIECKEITQTAIADLIFADVDFPGAVESLRKTTRPKAQWLLSNETLAAIKSQLLSTKT
jgi:hypothetical protein